MEPTETTPNDETQERRVRRRGYLGLAAGLVVGGTAVSMYHLLAPPKEVEKLTTKTATETETVTGTKTITGTKTVTEAQTLMRTETETVTETPTGIRARYVDTYGSKGTIPPILTEKTTYAVKITVLHCPDIKDVVPEEMIEEIKFNYSGPCPFFREGDEIEIQPGEPPKPLLGFDRCPFAWEAIYPYILHLGSGGDFLNFHGKKGVIAGACPDGGRPVSFLVERI